MNKRQAAVVLRAHSPAAKQSMQRSQSGQVAHLMRMVLLMSRMQ